METGFPAVTAIVVAAAWIARAVARRSALVTENRLLSDHQCKWCGAATRLHSTDEIVEIDGHRVRRRTSRTICTAQVERINEAREWSRAPLLRRVK